MTDEEARRLVHLDRMERFSILAGALLGILFVLAVIWLAGIVA